MWHIIRLPLLQVASAKQLEAVNLMVSRSGACALDIKIWWLKDLQDKDHLLSPMRSIISVLSDQAHRWSAVRLIFPGRVGRDALAALKGPTPKLELISITVRSREWDLDLESGYLPYAPMLKSLTLDDAAMACSTLATYPALTNATIRKVGGATSNHVVLDILSRTKESLETLEVNAWVDRSVRASDPLLLPHLQTLVLVQPRDQEPQSIPSVSLLRAPRLTHVDLRRDSIPAVPISFLAAISLTVRTLTFHNALTSDLLERLRNSQNVEGVEFGVWVSDVAYDTLTTHVPTIWPRLVAVDLRGLLKNSSCGPLIKFIAFRSLSSGESDAHSEFARPCRLREVTLMQDAPQWVVAEVQRLLAM